MNPLLPLTLHRDDDPDVNWFGDSDSSLDYPESTMIDCTRPITEFFDPSEEQYWMYTGCITLGTLMTVEAIYYPSRHD